MSLMNFVGDLAGYYRDIEVAKASPGGGMNGRTETIPDQTSVGRADQMGPLAKPTAPVSDNFVIAGVAINRSIVYTTAAVIGSIAIIKVLKS